MQTNLSAIWDSMRANDFESAAREAQKYLSDPDSSCASEARKILALAYFRLRNHAAAVPLFLTIAESSTEANDWFNVVTSATLSGNVSLGETAFERAMACQKDANFSQNPTAPFMMLYYGYALRDIGEFAKAFDQLDAIRAVFEGLPTTDSHYVNSLGVPQLAQVINLAVDILVQMRTKVNVCEWIDSFAANIDADGKSQLLELRQVIEGSK